MTIWKPVGEFSGKYEVSDEGKVRRASTGLILKTTIDKDGYETVNLYTPGGARNRRVNRLVCRAFHGEPPEGKPLALHGTNGVSDNTPGNLRWGSQSDNMRDRSRDGTCVNLEKRYCPQGHEYTEKNTYTVPGKNQRNCRECARNRVRAYRAEKRERQRGNESKVDRNHRDPNRDRGRN